MAETAPGGPFFEIASADIFINCVYLAGTPTPPFVTLESLSKSGRQLRVACNVSCDPTDPHNPVPIYHEITTFPNPTVPVKVDGDGPPLIVVSIDHLPSLVAREASNAFSELLLPSLKVLNRRNEEGVWTRAEKLFKDKVAELPVGNRWGSAWLWLAWCVRHVTQIFSPVKARSRLAGFCCWLAIEYHLMPLLNSQNGGNVIWQIVTP